MSGSLACHLTFTTSTFGGKYTFNRIPSSDLRHLRVSLYSLGDTTPTIFPSKLFDVSSDGTHVKHAVLCFRTATTHVINHGASHEVLSYRIIFSALYPVSLESSDGAVCDKGRRLLASYSSI